VIFKKFPATAEIFLNKGTLFVAGQRLVQRDLAGTLRSITKQGVDGFYGGKTGAAIVSASRAGEESSIGMILIATRPENLRPSSAIIGAIRDLGAAAEFRRYCRLRMLNILEAYPLRELGWGSAQALHDEIEAMRHAFVDRNSLGDPDFVSNPARELIGKSYAAKNPGFNKAG